MNDTGFIMMDGVEKILDSFRALQDAADALAKSLQKDIDLPFYIPTFDGDSFSPEAHDAAIESMTRLFHLESPIAINNQGEPVIARTPSFHAGIMCVSEKSLETALAFNTAKDTFKETVVDLRSTHKDTKTSIDKLMLKMHGPAHQRPEALKLLLKRAGISRVDLKRSYAHLRILPNNTQSVSWTWAVHHSYMKIIRYEEACKRVQGIEDEEVKSLISNLIDKIGKDQILIEMKPLPSSLRANLVFENNDPEKPGKLSRKAVTISGVLLYRFDSLPHFLWREDPALPGTIKPDRLPRQRQFAMDKEPYIKKFYWYRRELDSNEEPFKNE